MIIKAAIIGTHGTFKSTLVPYLGGALKEETADVYFVQEIARKCPYKLNGVDIRAQKWIVSRQYLKELDELRHFELIEEEDEESKDHPRIIACDRSTLDAYIYTVELCKKQRLDMPQWIPQQVSENMSSYDFLFLTSITPGGLVKDGKRSPDPAYQKTIDDMLRKYLKEKKIKHYPLDYSLIKDNPSPSKSDYMKLRAAQVEYMVDTITKKWKK